MATKPRIPDALARLIAEQAREIEDDAKGVLRGLQKGARLDAPVGRRGDDTGGARTLGDAVSGERVGAAPQRRHDASYVPAGYVERGKTLSRKTRWRQLTQAEILAGLSVARTIMIQLENEDYQEDRETGARILAAYEAIFGYPHGQGWRDKLLKGLEADAYVRENIRRGSPLFTPATDDCGRELEELFEKEKWGTLPEGRVVTDAEFLAWLNAKAPMPAELTVEVVHQMRASVSLGGGGGRGANRKVSAQSAVATFVRAIARKKAPKKAKKTRRRR